MGIAILMIRAIFMMASILFFSVHFGQANWFAFPYPVAAAAVGAGIGFICGSLIMSLEILLRRANIRALNTVTLGLFFGYFLGQALTILFHMLSSIAQLDIQGPLLSLIHVFLYLCATYWALAFTARSSDDFSISIPYIRFRGADERKKDIILDLSILSDPRLIDLCSSGLLDKQLIFPRFLLKEIYEQMEHGDEAAKAKARRCLDAVKRLETMQDLEMRIVDTDFPDLKEVTTKLAHLAQIFQANILTAEISRIQQNVVEDTKIININSLSNAMKPPKQYGESILIKVQRYGKEPRQGVGYLDDGTMVVVNGGAEYIGEQVQAQVLSVKHTSSGRMIFCNAIDETGTSIASPGASVESQNSGNFYHHL